MFRENVSRETVQLASLRAAYKQCINYTLPAAYSFPVKHNHCFARIVLDWLFQDCWQHHLNHQKPAVAQLNEMQLQQALARLQAWLQNGELLMADNNASLQYRRNRNRQQLLIGF